MSSTVAAPTSQADSATIAATPVASPSIYSDWKVVQQPGAFAYPVYQPDGKVINRLALFTRKKIKRYARTVNSMLADGISIPIIPEHDNKGVPLTAKELEKKILFESVGFIRGARVNANGDLELLHEVTDPLWVPRMGTTVKDCSPGFRDWYRTGDGKKWTDVVAHVALTHHPVDHHKPKFSPAPSQPPLEKPKAAGICVLARDTGRVLLLQRAIAADDQASGTWEFPGGHIEAGETPLKGAKREWAEETGLKLPRNAQQTGSWKSANGVYEGFVLTIPKEDALDINLYHEDRKVRNPDDPDGDCVETLAWWQPGQLIGNPAVRKELQLDLDKVTQATLLPVRGMSTQGSFSVTCMSLTPVDGPDAPKLVPIWEVPFSTAVSCLIPAGTSHIFRHADGKQRFGSRAAGVNWLRAKYSKQFSLKNGGADSTDGDSGVIWMAVMRAPIGGVSLQGKFFPGGQFIPNEVLEKATPEEKQKIQAAKEGRDTKRGADAKSNMKDAETVHQAILRHAGAHGMDEQHPLDKRDTLRRWSALKSEHGEQGALERVVTLAAKEAAALQSMGEDGKHSAMGKHYQRRLAAYAQMVGFAANPQSVDDYKKGLKEALAGEGGKRSITEAGSDPSKDKAGETKPKADETIQAAGETKPAPGETTTQTSDGNKKPTETPAKHPDPHQAIASAQHLSSVKKQQFGDAVKLVEGKLPQAAKDRLAKNLKGFAFHSDVEDLTAALIERSPDMKEKLGGKKAGGVYSKKTGELHLNGGERIDGKKVTPDAVYAHEYAHAIDGPEHELSKTADWKAAWKAEAQMVSRYATKTPQEGFAEFGRLVYSSGLGEDQLRERYPKMMAHWEGLGLLPDAMGKAAGEGQVSDGKTSLTTGNTPQMPDVFDEPFDTPDAIGDKPLSRRAEHEGLKDYLRGIGGDGAHDTIRDYAKQLHETAKAETDQHNAGVRHANDLLEQYGGKKFNRNHQAFKTGDLTQLPRFDEIATSVDSEHPGLLSGDKGQHLYERLKEGIRPAPELRDFEDQAVQEWHDNGRPMPDGYEPTKLGDAAESAGGGSSEGDTSFDFGENAKGKGQGGDEKQSATEPHPFKPSADDNKEAWEKFSAKAKAGGGLTLPADGDFTKQPAKEEASALEERNTDELLRQKMAAEENRTTSKSEAKRQAADEAIQAMAAAHKAGDKATAQKLLNDFDAKHGLTNAEAVMMVGKAKQMAKLQPKVDAPAPTLSPASTPSPSPIQVATGDFMKPAAAPKYSADDIEELAGQSFTNDKGLTVDVVKDEDGTWSVGKKYGLSAQAAANHLNELNAEPAQSLFGKDVTAQQIAEGKALEKKPQLEWPEPPKPKEEEGELSGMKDTFAPGMFGNEAGNETTNAVVDEKKEDAGKPVEVAPSVSLPAETHQEVNAGELFKVSDAVESSPKADQSTPREVAKALTRATDPSYVFARASSVGNAGADLELSKRHLANAWRGLEEAEQAGTAEKLVTRDRLLENEPHNLLTHAESNPMTAMAMHFALKSFPLKPEYRASRYSRARGESADEKAKKNRQQFLDAYRSIKGKAEQLAVSENDPKKALSSLADHVSDTIRSLRGQVGNDSMARAAATDIYNEIANALTKMPKQLRDGVVWGRPSVQSPLGKLMEFTNLAAQKHGIVPSTGTPEEKRAYYDKLKSSAKNVIEGQSPAKAFGVSSEKTAINRKPRITAAEMYVDVAERQGGREVPKIQSALKEHLLSKTGLRGLQFGNYVTDDERLHHLEKAAEAFVDLADVTGLPDSAVSLDGKLGIAFGARGSGGALAHYEPSTRVINLTRKSGVGSLAHEWGHALDHFVGNLSDRYSTKTDAVSEGMNSVLNAWNESGFNDRVTKKMREAQKEGKMNTKEVKYWGSNSEKFARTFEQWVQHELLERGQKNTYLAGFNETEYSGERPNGHALWPTRDEITKMAPAFRSLLHSVREKHFSSREMSLVSASRDERIQNLMIALQA